LSFSSMTSSYRQRFSYAVGVLLIAACLRLWHIAQTPPGLYLDEAFHLLRAQEIARGEIFPVFITGNNGYEPLFVYLSVIPLTILGPVAWAGRLAAAWAGLLSVALTWRAGSELFPKRPTGILAGLMLATLFWNLDFSRFGSQPILAATAAAGTMAALWRGVRTGSPWAYSLAGLSLGLGLDAYLGFRLFPLVPLASGLALLVARREKRPALLVGGLLAGGVALLVFTPLGLFFIQNPHWFFNRFNQTTEAILGGVSPGAALVANTLKTIGGLFVEGDSNWRHNLAGRPALDAVQALFFLVGAGVCLRRWRSPETWAIYMWLIVGLLPSAITFQSPHSGRAIMATPAIALLMAIGITAIWERVKSRAAHRVMVAAITLSVMLTTRDFWGRWAHDPHLFEFFEVQQEWIARALRTAPPGSALYATPMHIGYYHDLWPIEYFLGREAYQRFGSFNGQACSVVPSQTTVGATYAIIVPDDSTTPAALQAAYPDVTHTTLRSLAGAPYLDVYQLPPGQTARVRVGAPQRVDFGGLVRLVGYTLAVKTLQPGDTLHLRVLWEAEQTSQIAYKVFAHLIGPPKADGSLIYTQYDAEPCADTYPTWQWKVNDLVMETYSLPLPADLPPGDYYLQTGWYEGQGGGRLPAYDGAGQPLGDAARLEDIHITGP